jgi:hypothetical protein
MLSNEAIHVIEMPRAGRAAPSFYADPATMLRDLSAWHDDLDLAIGALVETGHYDDLALARLKKRKLQIRDEMAGVAARVQAEPAADGGEQTAVEAPFVPAAARGPGTASGLLMILAVMASVWVVLEAVTESASEIYGGLLILALLGG